MISDAQLLEAILRMVTAVPVGCIVGLDRNLHGKPCSCCSQGVAIERALQRRWLRTSPEEHAAVMRHDN